jgi:TetR/AcrR family transcriptional regulator, transcriptional repressor for nem operon
MNRTAADTPPESDTAQRILDIASRLVQTRGFNGFSYAHIAAELGVTKASLHYHYPSKAELGKRLIERYEQDFATALERIEAETDDAFERLQRYASIYAGVLGKEQMCLCGMLAAEHGTLPAPMRRTLQHYFDVNEAWLAKLLDGGRRRGQLRFDGPPREVAALLVGALEGAMMMARSYGDPRRFATASDRLLADMRANAAPARKAARR